MTVALAHTAFGAQWMNVAEWDSLSRQTDETLMSRFGRGDADAFEQLYRRYGDRLHRFVLRFTASPAETDEICQEVWTAVIHGKERFRGDARFVTYLFSIARRRTVERYRRPHDEDESAMEDLEGGDAPEQMLFNSQANAALSRAVSDLPLLQREAFLLRVEGGMDVAQIARVAGTNAETAKSRLRYAYRKLRLALEDWR